MDKLIRSTRYIGSGQFGIVEQGILTTKSGKLDVALKSLKDTSSTTNVVKFLQEAAIMIQFQHSNIISLLGLVNHEKVS